MRIIRASLVFACVLSFAGTASGRDGSDAMTLPVPASELADAIGLPRTDANLPLDLVRALYGSGQGTSDADAALAAAQRLLNSTPRGTDRIPLPLGASLWRKQLLAQTAADDRIAAAILGHRASALLYHGLLGIDEDTLRWFGDQPGALDALRKHPGTAAVFARSLHVRGGVVATPGDTEIWTALVGTEPSHAEAFVARLIESRGGRVAYLFDTIMHLDPAHQRFALAPARGENAVKRARALLDAVTESFPTWKIEDRPFVRADVDIGLFLRLVAVTPDGAIQGLASRSVWDRAFDERLGSNVDSGGGGATIDAAWLAGKILRPPASVGRERLDLLLFAQRALPDAASAPVAPLLEALRGFSRYPALMLTLERNGARGVATYASAARTAAVLERDAEAQALCQSALALIDRTRAASTLSPAAAVQLMSALLDVAGADRPSAARISEWIATRLVPALRSEHDIRRDAPVSAETVLVNALGGPASASPPSIEWEGRSYQVDVAAAERRRIERIRKGQSETPLDRALAEAGSGQGVRDLVQSLTGLVYAVAIGDPDGQALTGGAVWRRHRFRPDATTEDTVWRIANESFGTTGWHLIGSLLALDAALPRLALRRLDTSDVPQPTRMSTSDRRTLAMTASFLEAPLLTDAGRDAIAASIARGRERARSLAADASSVDAVCREAGMSEWRTTIVRSLLQAGADRIVSMFTLVELYRLGRPDADAKSWGAAALPLDGSLERRTPEGPWEEFTGRAATGQLGSQFVDVQFRTAEVLAELRLPAAIGRDVAAFAIQDVIDRARPAYFDDFLSIAFAARDLERERFEDYVSALTASGPLIPIAKTRGRQH